MSKKLRLQATMIVEVEYEVDPAAYGTDDPQQIVKMDQKSFSQNPANLLGWGEGPLDIESKERKPHIVVNLLVSCDQENSHGQ